MWIRMSYDDWLRNFDNCQICNLTPETVSDGLTEKDWQNDRFLSVTFISINESLVQISSDLT